MLQQYSTKYMYLSTHVLVFYIVIDDAVYIAHPEPLPIRSLSAHPEPHVQKSGSDGHTTGLTMVLASSTHRDGASAARLGG
jgi:hypothetical protein